MLYFDASQINFNFKEATMKNTSPQKLRENLNEAKQQEIKQPTARKQKQPVTGSLFNAAIADRADRIKLLVENGMNVNARDPYTGETPLHYAAMASRQNAVAALIEMKADVNAITMNQDKPEHYFRGTPMHLAVRTATVAVIELLANAGADLNCYDERGDTALHNVLYSCINGSKKEVIVTLLKHGADPTYRDQYNMTPAMVAYSQGEEEVGHILLEAERVIIYKQAFNENVKQVLLQYKTAATDNSAEFKFLDDLIGAIKSSKDTDEVFKSISAALKSPGYSIVKAKLAPMRELLITIMKKYNLDKATTLKQLVETSNGCLISSEYKYSQLLSSTLRKAGLMVGHNPASTDLMVEDRDLHRLKL